MGNKWRELDSTLESAYPVFLLGSKFNIDEQEASNFEKR